MARDKKPDEGLLGFQLNKYNTEKPSYSPDWPATHIVPEDSVQKDDWFRAIYGHEIRLRSIERAESRSWSLEIIYNRECILGSRRWNHFFNWTMQWLYLIHRKRSLLLSSSIRAWVRNAVSKGGELGNKETIQETKAQDRVPSSGTTCFWPTYLTGLLSLRLVGAVGARNYVTHTHTHNRSPRGLDLNQGFHNCEPSTSR